MIIFWRILMTIILMIPASVFAQDGLNDPTFNSTDIGFNSGTTNLIHTVAVRNDGRILVGAEQFTTFNDRNIGNHGILNPDGSLRYDIQLIDPNYEWIYCSAVLSDGNFLLGGANFLKRTNDQDTMDVSFNPTLDGEVLACVVQSDGKILIGGKFTSVNGTTVNRIARLNEDGSVDPTFQQGTGANMAVEEIAIQSDGKILIGGAFSSYNNVSKGNIVRLNPDGSIDNTFNPGTGASNNVYAIAIQSDGKILVGGKFSIFNESYKDNLVRLNANGTFDSFFYLGAGPDNTVFDILVASDGKIIIGGAFSKCNGSIALGMACIENNGYLNTNINFCASGTVKDLFQQNDGKILACGKFTTCQSADINGIFRWNADYSLDTHFNIGTGPNNEVWVTEVLADDKIIIAGAFTKYSGINAGRIVRLNEDGTRDVIFNSTIGANGEVYTVAIQSDQKIIVGGAFTEYNGVSRNRIVRLNVDGSIDPSFDIGTGFSGNVTMVAVQSDGKIVVAGDFTSYKNAACVNSVRLNPDGSVDPGFTAGTYIQEIGAFAILGDGKIVSGGPPTEYFGERNLCRLNSNGSIDQSFNTGTGINGWISKIAAQPDGSVIVVGYFTQYKGVTRNKIARILSNGDLDMIFDPGTGFNSNPRGIHLLQDGKILVYGHFTRYNNSNARYLARLNPDETLDNTFHHGRHADAPVIAAALQSNGKIIIGGVLCSYDGIGRNSIGRLNNTLLPLTVTDGKKIPVNSDLAVFPNPAHNVLHVDAGRLNSGFINLKVLNSNGIVIREEKINHYLGSPFETIDISKLPEGIYFLEMITEQGKAVKKLVIH